MKMPVLVPEPAVRGSTPKAFFSPVPERSGCALPDKSDCRWSPYRATCNPIGADFACRNVECGLVSCDCQLTPSHSRPPWRLLSLSSAACPDAIHDAFENQSMRLQPKNNPECIRRAQQELRAVKHARDSMLGLVHFNLAMGGTCDPTASQTAPAGGDPWSHIEEMGGGQQPLLVSAWRATRQWIRSSVRTMRAKVTKVLKHSPWLVMVGAVVIQGLAMAGILPA